MQPKPIFKSKTGFFAAIVGLTGALGYWAEPVNKFLADHANSLPILFSIISLAIRRITHERVTFFGDS